MSERVTRNPELFARMDAPFTASAEAEQAVHAFLTDLEALREKHRIANVYTIVEVRALDEGGDALAWFSRHFRGDSRNLLPMVARAYGAEREVHEELLARTVRAGRQQARRGR